MGFTVFCGAGEGVVDSQPDGMCGLECQVRSRPELVRGMVRLKWIH